MCKYFEKCLFTNQYIIYSLLNDSLCFTVYNYINKILLPVTVLFYLLLYLYKINCMYVCKVEK